jgi:hypothetical protein
MVKSGLKTLGTALRRVQIVHTILFLVFLTYVGLSPAFNLKLDSGQSFRILATQGPTGQFLFWSAVLVVGAQILSFKRVYSLSVVTYAWVGSSFIFVGIAVPAGESVLNSEIDNFSRIIDWMAKELKFDFDVAEVNIQTGVAWHLLILAGLSLACLAFALLTESNRMRSLYPLQEPLH